MKTLPSQITTSEEYFERMLNLFSRFMETPSEEVENEMEKEILAMSYDRLKLQEDRIKELEEALKESTGYTTELRDSLARQSGKYNVPNRKFIIDTCTELTKSIERFESLLKQ